MTHNARGRTSRRLLFLMASIVAVVGVYLLFPHSDTNTTQPMQPVSSQKQRDPNAFRTDGILTILRHPDTTLAVLNIEIADTEPRRTRGLMYRRTMTDGQGMLFIFPIEEYQSFWMKNTYLPLDILYINAKNSIVTIHRNTIPLSEESYISTQPAMYVLEVVGGFSARHRVVEGDSIAWKRK